MIKNGIDVSKHQGTINWAAVSTDFAIIQAGYGRLASQKDPFFEINYKGCTTKRIPCGAYWYSYATSVDDAILEAKACLEVLKGKKFEYPIYYDIEEQRTLRLGKTVCTEIAKAFLNTLEKAGYWAGLYASKNVLENYFPANIGDRYALWVAHYGVDKTTYKGNYGMWQKSDKGRINGIIGDVDLNVCHIDYPKMIKIGFNGYSEGNVEEIKEAPTYKKGNKVPGTSAVIYASSDAKNGFKRYGSFYLYDGDVVNGRLRVTTRLDLCGKSPVGLNVTGWIDAYIITK